MKSWRSRFAVLVSSVAGLALPGCGGGGGGVVEVEAGTEPLPVSYQLQASDRPLDVGVYGDGLFVLQATQGGPRTYSRLGRLDLDRDGYLIHADGARVLGVADDPAVDAAPLPAAPLAMAARASRRITLVANLDSRTQIHDASVAFDPDDPGTYNNAIGFSVWSDDGRSHDMVLYIGHMAAPNPARGEYAYWIVHASVDSLLTAVQQALHFELPTAMLPESERLLRLPAGDTGLPHDVEIDFGGTTEYGAWFGVSELRTDGYGPGVLSAVTVEADGGLLLNYDNGQTAAGGRLVLARFTVADRLRRTGESSWTCELGCSAPALGAPGSALMGTIRAGALNTAY